MGKLKNVARAEKTRKLTPAEERRLAKFEETCAALEARGYVKSELTVGIVAANVVAVVVMIPVFVLGILLFCWANAGAALSFDFDALDFALGLGAFLVVFLVLIVVHELVHGAVWACFAPRRFKDVEFGFMVQYLTPYCTCAAPLHRGAYVAGALAPLVLLGVVPAAVGIACGWFSVLFMGLLMIVSATGDAMIVAKLLRFKSVASDVVFCDHPTQAGLVAFTRDTAGAEGGEGAAVPLGEEGAVARTAGEGGEA